MVLTLKSMFFPERKMLLIDNGYITGAYVDIDSGVGNAHISNTQPCP